MVVVAVRVDTDSGVRWFWFWSLSLSFRCVSTPIPAISCLAGWVRCP